MFFSPQSIEDEQETKAKCVCLGNILLSFISTYPVAAQSSTTLRRKNRSYLRQ